MNLDLNSCPTCRQKKVEEAPGIWVWHTSAYKLYDTTRDCHCEWQDELRRHYLLAGIPKGYWTLSEQDFFGDSNALASVKDYLDHWVDYKWHGIGLQLYSATQGTGKTMLASMIAKDLIVRGEKVKFESFGDIVQLYSMPWEQRETRERELKNTPVLILDEVRHAVSEAQRAFFATELENLVRARVAGASVTILTTNMTVDDLEHEYPRCFSLLSEKQQFVRINGHDVRKAGDIDLMNQEMILNGEARPITPDLHE